MNPFPRMDRLWLGFLVALVPLLVLLVFQYQWLRRFERVSRIAYEATVTGALSAIRGEIELAYRSLGEDLLDIDASTLEENDLGSVADFWARTPRPGVRRLFLVDYTDGTAAEPSFGRFFFFDEESGRVEPLLASDEALAVIVACTPWQMAGQREQRWRSSSVLADDRDPAHQILLRPLLDPHGHVAGVAGLILEEDHLRDHLLPEAIARALPEAGARVEDGLVVQVQDGRGRVVLGPESLTGLTTVRTARLSFVFTDWTLGLYQLGPILEGWTGSNQRVPLFLSALLALALLAGVALALQAAKRAMRLSAMKADFVSNVSHELRTPVASIRVFADLLRSGRVATEDKVIEYGERIESESRRLSFLIDKILEFSRMESGRKTYRFSRLDPADLLRRVVDQFRSRPVAQGFGIDLEIAPGPLPDLSADADALGQAIDNLLENAVKYSGEAREVGVRLAASGMGSADPRVVIEVTDRGIGIDRAEQKRIFERFHRVGQRGAHDVQGSGLGLAIVHEVVKAHGGSVSVESEPGRGSTFRLNLPARRREDAA